MSTALAPAQVEEDEKENLRKAEERLKVCAAEAAFIAEMGGQSSQPQPPPPGEPDQAPAQEGAHAAEPDQAPPAQEGAHAAALQERLKEAEEKVARLRKLAAGPLIPPVLHLPVTNT